MDMADRSVPNRFHTLQIGVPTTLRYIMSVADVMADLGVFAAYFA